MRVFFDTSAFAKRYIREDGSQQVLALCGQADALAVSVICLPEMVSTLSRLVREAKLSDGQYRAAKKRVLADLDDVDMCEITPSVMANTLRFLEDNPLRAMDAIHLGCAVAYQPDVFVSADRRQIGAAVQIGLNTVDLSGP